MSYPPRNHPDHSSFNTQSTRPDNHGTLPGQFGPPSPRLSSTPRNPYPKSVPLVLLLAYTAFWLCEVIFANGAAWLGTVGISLFWGIVAYVLIVDWWGSVSLGGWIQWGRMQSDKRVVPGCLYVVFFPFLLGIYLLRAVFVYRSFAPLAATTASRRQRIGAVVASLVLLGSLFIYTTGNASGTGLVSSTTSAQGTQTVSTPVMRTTPRATTQALGRVETVPTALPTVAPTPTPRPPTPTSVPTQPPVPTPTPAHVGVNNNPWGYDFTPGTLIYDPPTDFCSYFNCIASFWQSTNGYVDECQDGTYSHSGGVRGACSHHGGEMRPLYSH